MSQESPAPLLFADLGLSEPVMKAVAAVGYETPIKVGYCLLKQDQA